MNSMDMSTSMPMSATSSGAMAMSTSGGMSSMGMMMDMSQMSMTFFTSTATPLYSNAWTPSSTGTYAGTCIFLIALSVILRFMYGVKVILEAHWRNRDLHRRTVIAAGPPRHKDSVAASMSEDEELVGAKSENGAQVGTLTVGGTSELVRVVESVNMVDELAKRAPAFKLNVDLVRAAFVTVMVGVGYLLMLAVMTMNVGYFLSVLAGAFLGELLFGRWSTHAGFDHH